MHVCCSCFPSRKHAHSQCTVSSAGNETHTIKPIEIRGTTARRGLLTREYDSNIHTGDLFFLFFEAKVVRGNPPLGLSVIGTRRVPELFFTTSEVLSPLLLYTVYVSPYEASPRTLLCLNYSSRLMGQTVKQIREERKGVFDSVVPIAYCMCTSLITQAGVQ